MTEAGMSQAVDQAEFGLRPELMLLQTRAQSLGMDPDDVAAIQLDALRHRFDNLKPKIKVLRNLAHEAGIDRINHIDEAAPLLFKHSVYKAYPVSLIENNRYDRLTAWLQNLTAVDLSTVHTTGIDSIDAWIDVLMRDAGVRIVHSTGSSGKLSFLPRTLSESDMALRSFRLSFESAGEVRGLDHVPIIVPGHRQMFNGYGTMLYAVVNRLFDGDDSLVLCLDPGRLSADVLSLGGRLSAAASKGDIGRNRISPQLLARRDEFVEAQKQAPARRAAFFDAIATRLKGQRVAMSGNWAMLHEMMEEGQAKGLNSIFAQDSMVIVAGGTKGKLLPDGFKEDIRKFLGVAHINEGFGMSEMTALMPQCSAGKYHAMPWMVLYLLDGKTGELAPRVGTHTGRFGVMDLSAQTYWGGFLSGDEVTMSFGRCACGTSGPFIDDRIRRFSEIEGGDDKITCAGAPEAHDKALAFLADFE